MNPCGAHGLVPGSVIWAHQVTVDVPVPHVVEEILEGITCTFQQRIFEHIAVGLGSVVDQSSFPPRTNNTLNKKPTLQRTRDLVVLAYSPTSNQQYGQLQLAGSNLRKVQIRYSLRNTRLEERNFIILSSGENVGSERPDAKTIIHLVEHRGQRVKPRHDPSLKNMDRGVQKGKQLLRRADEGVMKTDESWVRITHMHTLTTFVIFFMKRIRGGNENIKAFSKSILPFPKQTDHSYFAVKELCSSMEKQETASTLCILTPGETLCSMREANLS